MKFLYSFRLFRAVLHSIDGVKASWQEEQAFRQEIYASIILLPIIFYLAIPSVFKLALILLLLLLLVVETLNSAIETIVDRISLEIHIQSKMAKDMGSAAVSMVIIMNVFAWIYVVFWVL